MVPVNDKIDARSFEYSAIHQQPYRGLWEWGLNYKEELVPAEEVSSWPYSTSPYRFRALRADMYDVLFVFDTGK